MVKTSAIPKAIKDPKKAIGFARRKFDSVAGKILFKNNAGLQKNLNARKSLEVVKIINFETTLQESTNAHVSEFVKNGYVNLDCPFDSVLINNIAKKCSEMIEDDRYSFMRSQYGDKIYSRMLNRAFKLIPEVKDLLTDDIINMVKEYYQGNFRIKHVMMWRNYHVPPDIATKKEIFSSYWHVDGEDPAITTLFVNLSNVTDKNGPLHLQSKERTKELVKMGFKSRFDYNLPHDVIEDPNHVVKHKGPVGSTIWVNTELCLHRADNLEPSQHRDMFQFRFVPSTEPLKEDWLDHCEDDPVEIAHNQRSILANK